MEQYSDVFRWLLMGAGSVLSVVGVGKLLEMLFKRRWEKQDDRAEQDETNHSIKLKTDADFRNDLIKRIDKLEVEQKEMAQKLLEQSVESARRETENKYLTETNRRQEDEIKHLREDKNSQAQKIADLEKGLAKAQADLSNAQKQIGELMYELGQIRGTSQSNLKIFKP